MEDKQPGSGVATEEEPLATPQAGQEETTEAAGSENELAEELEKVRAEAREHYDRMLRMAAELENFKRRMEREQATMLKYAEEDLLRELLPSIDNLERAMEQGRKAEDSSSLLEGVEMTHSGLMKTLAKFGLEPLDGVGETFDPNYHEAIAMEPSDEAPANTILQEYERGYMYKDRLLRAAKVIVSSGSAGA